MNKSKKSNSMGMTIAISAVLILLSRAALVLLFAILAYSGSDPDARIPLFSFACRLCCEFLCGFWVGRALSKNFTPLTRSLFTSLVSLILCAAEIVVGRAIAGGGVVNVFVFIAALLCAALGGRLSSHKTRKSAKKRHKRV